MAASATFMALTSVRRVWGVEGVIDQLMEPLEVVARLGQEIPAVRRDLDRLDPFVPGAEPHEPGRLHPGGDPVRGLPGDR